MKYFSEITNQVYDTPEELNKAELDATRCTVSECDDTFEDQPDVTTPTKKQLASAVEEAEKAVEEAYSNYEVAKQKAQELSKKYLADLSAIMDPAKKAVKKAEQTRYTAVQKFNQCFGPYQTTYTGARAANEFAKALSALNKLDKNVLGNWLWI